MVTRARPKTDRIACSWLIRRFIDPHAKVRYVPADRVLAVPEIEAARSFDAPDGEVTHRGDQCTFEVSSTPLTSAATRPERGWLASSTRPTSQATWTDPVGPWLLAIGEGGLAVEADDRGLLALGQQRR